MCIYNIFIYYLDQMDHTNCNFSNLFLFFGLQDRLIKFSKFFKKVFSNSKFFERFKFFLFLNFYKVYFFQNWSKMRRITDLRIFLVKFTWSTSMLPAVCWYGA